MPPVLPINISDAIFLWRIPNMFSTQNFWCDTEINKPYMIKVGFNSNANIFTNCTNWTVLHHEHSSLKQHLWTAGKHFVGL